MKAIYVAKSNIHGRGVFSVNDLNQNDIIGVSHVSYERVWYQVHPIGIFYNHSNKPNCVVKTEDNVNLLVAIRDIKKDEELTVDYTKQLYLEQPQEDWI
jgi:SET domain-containing protein